MVLSRRARAVEQGNDTVVQRGSNPMSGIFPFAFSLQISGMECFTENEPHAAGPR
jgi:hypothetical protein